EGLMEGFFAKAFRSGLQPVEVGRRMVREMEENRTVSVNSVYAPNEFRIFISPDDYERFGPMEAGLQREFGEMVIDAAKKNRWHLMGVPRISFHETEELGKGEYRTEASLTADPDAPGPRASTHEPDRKNLSATRAISSDTAQRLGMTAARVQLIVLDEHGDAKERIDLTSSPVAIGRQSTNDVVLPDPNVSRQHAELRQKGDGWVIADLGSTNGTSVNGKPAREQTLQSGDRISFGTSDLLFEMTPAT
nr:DUF3662 and FHA domain-containing protein [Actinomycetota bacterium]